MVQRYDLSGCDAKMLPYDDGDYVAVGDYLEAIAEVERLKGQVDELYVALETLLGENEDSDYLTNAEQIEKAKKALKKARGE